MMRSSVAKHDEESGRSAKNPTLPLELISEILLRLPVRYVLRFKCVCRSWLSLISNPQFGISHYDLDAAPSHRILFRSNDFYIESVDIESHLDKDSSGVDLVLPPPSPPRRRFQYNCYHHFRIKPEFLGSCRGLILLYYHKSDDIILWNPSIGAHKRLPDINYSKITREYLYGFGYDASTHDYLLILIESCGPACLRTKTIIHVFSFKTYLWNTQDVHVSYSGPYESGAGLLFNGALHWLVFFKAKMVPVIIAFDLKQRSLSEIHMLDHFAMEIYEMYSLSLGVMEGCLSVCCSVRGCATTEIWVMKEYNVQSSWIKSFVIPTQGFSLICITKDGAILGSNTFGRLEKRNHKGELLEIISYGADQQLYYGNLQSAMYRESLLSLPSVIRGNR